MTTILEIAKNFVVGIIATLLMICVITILFAVILVVFVTSPIWISLVSIYDLGKDIRGI